MALGVVLRRGGPSPRARCYVRSTPPRYDQWNMGRSLRILLLTWLAGGLVAERRPLPALLLIALVAGFAARRRPLRVLVLVVLIAGLAAGGVSLWRHRRLSLASQVVTGVRSGALVPDPDGIVRLPPPLAAAADEGKVFVTYPPQGGVMVLIPEWRGKGSNLRGLLYWSAPTVPPPQYIGCVGPYVPMVPTDRWAGPVDLTVSGRPAANWFEVYFDGN